MPTIVEIPRFGIVLELHGEPGNYTGGSLVTSNISAVSEADFDAEEDAGELDAALNGIESLLLGLAVAGVDLTTEAVADAIDTAREAVANRYT